MNGKKAKMLRRLAREATQGLPERDYRADERTIRKRKFQSGAVVETGTLVLFQCTRQVYKALKKDYKRCQKKQA